jgi:hypothetical protein
MGLLEIFQGQRCRRKNVNVAVAAFITTQARLKLHEYLSKLGQSVFYGDTDTNVRTLIVLDVLLESAYSKNDRITVTLA